MLVSVARPGRRKKPDGEALSESLHFRVTRDEADLICLGALRSGLSISEFVRLGLRHIFESASFRVNRDVVTGNKH